MLIASCYRQYIISNAADKATGCCWHRQAGEIVRTELRRPMMLLVRAQKN